MKRVRRAEEEEEERKDGRAVGDGGVIFEWVPVLPTSQDARMPGCQDARKGAGGRWAQRNGVWAGGVGQGGNWATSDWKGQKGRTSGRREGPMREATGNLAPVQGEDARPPYPWSPTWMPDRPISLRPTSSTPRLPDYSTPRLSWTPAVCLSVRAQSVVLSPSQPILWPSLESVEEDRKDNRLHSQFASSRDIRAEQPVGLSLKAVCCLPSGRGAG